MLAKLRPYLPLILIIILASVLRLWMLGQVPISMSDDEIRLVYSGYSISQTGKDAFGNFLPIVFHMDGASTYGQVPIYLSSLFFLLLPLNPFVARLPFALSGILSVILLYFVVRKILNNSKIASFSAFAMSISVWNLQMTRFAIEIDIAVVLYLAAILIFLYYKKNLKTLISSMVLFFLAFYSYAATKVIFIPLFLALIWYKFKDLNKKSMVIIIATALISFGSFIYLSYSQGASDYSSFEGKPFFFMDRPRTALSVELERRVSNEPTLIKTLYHNKFTYWGRTAITNYLIAFSPQYLFLNQESSGIYSIWGRGEMYIFELIFVLTGAFYLFLTKRKEFYLILLLLAISPLPSAVGIGTTWTSRSGFMTPILYILVGTGIYFVINLFRNNYKYSVYLLIFVAYLYALFGYLSQYYYDWSQTNAKYFSKSTKDLVFILNKYKTENKKVVVGGADQNTFMHFGFYSKIDPLLIQKNINSSPIKFDNFTLEKFCLKEIPKNVVYIAQVECKYKEKPSLSIKEYNGSEVVWNIYEK